MSETTVFVYGTLKREGYLSLHKHLPEAQFISTAEIQGQLRECGIPYLLPFGARMATSTAIMEIFTSHDVAVSDLIPHIKNPLPWNDSEWVPRVRGELWTVDNDSLRVLDRIEGVQRSQDGSVNPASCHYLPVWVTARYEDLYGEVFTTALAYSYNVLQGADYWLRCRPIPSGNYITALHSVLP